MRQRVNRRAFRARYVFPVVGDPIPNGVVTIEGDRIVEVGRRPVAGSAEDLGNVAILPGLVNAHTHLEFSDLHEPLGEPGMPFVDWIRLVIDRFRHGNESTQRAVRRGLEESGRAGTTALGEIAQPGFAAETFDNAGLDAMVFLELIAPTQDRIAPLLAPARQHVRARGPLSRWQPGLSPHAPYSVLPELFDIAVSLSASARVPIAFHLAESTEEMELIRSGGGPFGDCFDELGTCEPSLFGGGGRPLDYLRQLAEAHRALVIHGNYLDDEEIAFLAAHADRMAVVYCPRTHAYFRHGRYPLRQMLASGALVALGTDSRASSPDLSVMAEMRFVAQNHPDIGRDVVLRLGTRNAAEALGRAGEIGTLEPGKYADLAIIALPTQDAADPHTLLFDAQGKTVATVHRGRDPFA